MAKTTLKQHITRRFYQNFKEGKTGFVNAQLVEDVMHDLTGRKHETIGRELRRMAEEEILEKTEIKNPKSKISSVYYKFKPTPYQIEHNHLI